MKHFAKLTVRAKAAIERRDHLALADLMDENFSTRRRLYGDACLGQKNLHMIDICKRCGAAVKFPGSGGAVLGLCRPPQSETKTAGYGEEISPLNQVRDALEMENYVFCALDPVMPANSV